MHLAVLVVTLAVFTVVGLTTRAGVALALTTDTVPATFTLCVVLPPAHLPQAHVIQIPLATLALLACITLIASRETRETQLKLV